MSKLRGSAAAGSSKRGKGSTSDNKRSDEQPSRTMYAVVTTTLGAADVLQVRLVPKAKPKANEVLVEVAYAGVNRPDIHQREIMLPPDIKNTRSEYLGLECSGKVSEHGAGLSEEDKKSWKIGNTVCAITNGGSYAEYVAVPVANLLPIPSNTTLKQAATFPQAACTVWSELFMKERLSEGLIEYEYPVPGYLPIHGGSSGIGTFAIQMAKHQGVTVYVTAGSNEKLEACGKLGAHGCINYHKEEFEKVVMKETKGKGVDVILDCLGEKYLLENLTCLSSGGRLVTIGPCCNMSGQDAHKFYTGATGRHRVKACALRNRTPESKAAIVKEVRSHVWPAIEAGHVKAYDNKIPAFPFKRAADAHKRMEKGDFTGKILLYPGTLP